MGRKPRKKALAREAGEGRRRAGLFADLVREHLERLGAMHFVQIFATDLDAEVLAGARLGRYPLSPRGAARRVLDFEDNAGAAASLRGTKRVALTGHTAPEDIAKAMEAGFDDHLAKLPAVDSLERALAPNRPIESDDQGAP